MSMRALAFAALPLVLACAANGASSAALTPVLARAPDMRAAEPLMEPDVSEGRPVSAATEKNVRSFLDRFVDANNSPAQLAALFADDAQYYGRGVIGKEEIAQEAARYNKHWPYRLFRVSEISSMHADPESDGVFVAYTIDFEVANSMRAITGKAHYAALIANPDGTPKMKAIRERVTRRLPGSPGAGLPAAE